jgi:hypothetical protein
MKKLIPFVVLILIIGGIVWLNIPSSKNLSASSITNPPPTPTPGLPPPDLPHFLPDSTPISTQEEAIAIALDFDSLWTARNETIDSSKILVEYYANRQEAADKYDLGVFVDKEDALDPTWVVILPGEVQANSIARIG